MKIQTCDTQLNRVGKGLGKVFVCKYKDLSSIFKMDIKRSRPQQQEFCNPTIGEEKTEGVGGQAVYPNLENSRPVRNPVFKR